MLECLKNFYKFVFLSLPVTELLLTGDSAECAIPGGWGANGANDGWHQFMHSLTYAFKACAVGWGQHVNLRKSLDELQISVQGSVETKKLGWLVWFGQRHIHANMYMYT